jgi:hypothetical protein
LVEGLGHALFFVIAKLAVESFDQTLWVCVDELIVGRLGATVSKYTGLDGP